MVLLNAQKTSTEKKLLKDDHLKGKFYEVMEVIFLSQTQEEMIICRELFGDHNLCAHPLQLFLKHMIMDDKEIQRFRSVRNVTLH